MTTGRYGLDRGCVSSCLSCLGIDVKDACWRERDVNFHASHYFHPYDTHHYSYPYAIHLIQTRHTAYIQNAPLKVLL